MNDVIETIRSAVAPEATAEVRAAGASACRMVLAALEGTPGESLAVAAPTNVSQISSIVGALRGVPADQLLDLAIAKLRAALPADANVQPVAPLKFHIIPTSKLRGTP
jgi:hypothetical protein